MGIAFRTGIGGTGIVALLEGAKPGPTVAIRADMDALPMSEPAGLPFASKVPGKMHSCGHDAHTTIALGVAAVLSDMRATLAGRVMFIFQPAEETLTGARAMLDAGAFDGPTPDAILGFHNWPQLRDGHRGLASGRGHGVVRRVRRDAEGSRRARRASASRRRRHRRRRAFHRSAADHRQPRDRSDQLGGRDHRPHPGRHRAQHHRVVGGVERVGAHAGIRRSPTKVEAAVRRILDGLKTGMRIDYDLKWTKLTPVLRNDKPTMARVLNVAREMLGPANVIEMPFPSMGSEDYAWFAERVPSAHLRIGSKIDGHDTAIHRADYQLNEEMIPLGTKLMSRAVLSLMG